MSKIVFKAYELDELTNPPLEAKAVQVLAHSPDHRKIRVAANVFTRKLDPTSPQVTPQQAIDYLIQGYSIETTNLSIGRDHPNNYDFGIAITQKDNDQEVTRRIEDLRARLG